MTEIGIYFPDDRPRKLVHNACYNSWTHAWLLCGSASRLGLHGHWVAAQVMWTKALPTLLLSYLLSPYFPFLCFFTITQHTRAYESSLRLTGLATPNCQTSGSTSSEWGCRASVRRPTVSLWPICLLLLRPSYHWLPCVPRALKVTDG